MTTAAKFSTADDNETQREIFVNCLQKQLTEVGMLSSIYCNPGEIQIYDPSVISDFEDFINDESIKYPKKQLDFSIYIQNEEKDAKVEIYINLPHLYPILEVPRLRIRSAFPNKQKEISVMREIENYIEKSDEIDRNEAYVYQIISWIQDSLERFLTFDISDELSNLNIDNSKNVGTSEKNSQNDDSIIEFERLWILSHHIKSKIKRQEIVRNAKNLNLSGFSKPGKPGIICVEGLKENTQEFWKIIKSMTWQRINVKLNEIEKTKIENLDRLRRFNGFKEELVTEVEDKGFAPMSMSLLMKYLEAHNSGYIKKELFGFD